MKLVEHAEHMISNAVNVVNLYITRELKLTGNINWHLAQLEGVLDDGTLKLNQAQLDTILDRVSRIQAKLVVKGRL